MTSLKETTKYTVGDSFGQLLNLDEPIGDKLVKIILSLMNTGIDIGVDITLGSDITSKTINELKNDILQKLNIIKELAKDPVVQTNVADAAREIVSLSLDTVEQVEEPLNRIVDRLLFMISDITNKSVRGSLETARGVAVSALAEIPVIGGLLDLAVTAGISLNRGADVLKSGVTTALDSLEFINKVSQPAIENLGTINTKINETKNSIQRRVDAFDAQKKRIENLQSITQPSLQRGGGGGYSVKKDIRDTVSRINKRLHAI